MTKTECPRCRKEPAIVHAMYGALPGKKCRDKDRKKVAQLTPPPQFATLTMRDRVTGQQDRFGKDIIQPYIDGANPNPDFVKAYPDMATEYFSQEQLEKL